jgi:hypothetical protein
VIDAERKARLLRVDRSITPFHRRTGFELPLSARTSHLAAVNAFPHSGR